jgi:hypothetical protein
MLNEDNCNKKLIKIILNNLESKIQTLNLSLEKRKIVHFKTSMLMLVLSKFWKLFLFLCCLITIVVGYYFYLYVK